MNKELIEKLKDKNYVRAFGLMTPEEQECIEKVGLQNCLALCQPLRAPGPHIVNWVSGEITGNLKGGTTYVIKPDYQPDPEFVDVEITQQGSWLGITRPWAEDYSRFPYDFTNLYCLPSLPSFEEFRYHSKGSGMTICTASFAGLAKQLSLGKTVYARFRK